MTDTFVKEDFSELANRAANSLRRRASRKRKKGEETSFEIVHLKKKDPRINALSGMGLVPNQVYIIKPSNDQEAIITLKYLDERNIPYSPIGRGTNTFFAEDISKMVLDMNGLTDISVEKFNGENVLKCGAGVLVDASARRFHKGTGIFAILDDLRDRKSSIRDHYMAIHKGTKSFRRPSLVSYGLTHNMPYFLLLADLPGTVAAGLRNNAANNIQSIGSMISGASVYLSDIGEVVDVTPDQMNLRYRNSVFKEKENRDVILAVYFSLDHSVMFNACLDLVVGEVYGRGKIPKGRNCGSFWRKKGGYETNNGLGMLYANELVAHAILREGNSSNFFRENGISLHWDSYTREGYPIVITNLRGRGTVDDLEKLVDRVESSVQKYTGVDLSQHREVDKIY
jgi:UDP-N-acetylenolpyruvoylglucosamine reductase